jgi:hypothetical protein
MIKTLQSSPHQPGQKVRGQFRLTLESSDGKVGRLLTVHGERQARAWLGSVPVGETTEHIDLTPMDAVQSPRAWSREVPAPDSSSGLDGHEELALLERSRLAAVAGEAHVDDLVATLISRPQASLKDLQPDLDRLVALMTLHPEACREVARKLAQVDVETTAFQALAMALTTTGTAAAQEALAEVMATDLEDRPHAVELLIPHLSLTQTPTTATEGRLRQLANDDSGGTARLALGSIAHQLQDADPERAHRLVTDLDTELARASTPRERTLLLSALGNAGAPDQTATIAPFADDSDPAVRERAVNALRLIDTPEAHDLLERKARTDPSSAVRARAVEALSFTPPAADLLPLYRDILADETSLPVVKEAAHNLFLMSRTQPEALAALTAFAARCAHPDLCTYVDVLLRSATMAATH